MTPAARLSAAIEVLEAIDTNRSPAQTALKEWGTAHRFAGSGDRAAIAGLVFDALRRRSSGAYVMDEDTPHGRLLGALRLERGLDTAAIAALCSGERFAPAPLSDAERSALDTRTLDHASPDIAGDYPAWLDPHLAEAFGVVCVLVVVALASRAPHKLRVNTLRSKPEKALAALSHLGAQPTPWSSLGLRIV